MIGNYTKLMIVGGRDRAGASPVINLSGDGKTCTSPAPYPGPSDHGFTGAYINGMALVCGGQSSTHNKCYRYSSPEAEKN